MICARRCATVGISRTAAPHVPGLAEALALDDPAVLGVCLSGAGPSVAGIATRKQSAAAGKLLGSFIERHGHPARHSDAWRASAGRPHVVSHDI